MVPYLAPRRGQGQVAGFFETVGSTLEFHSFEPVAMFEAGDQVMTRCRFDVTSRATGTRFQDEEIHLFTFGADGKVTAFRHWMDTLKHVEALQE